MPKYHPHYPLVYPGEDDPPPPPQEPALRALAKRLPDDVLYRLLEIGSISFIDPRTSDKPELHERIRSWNPTRERAEESLATDEVLGETLADALMMYAEYGMDVDAPPLAAVGG